VVLSPDEFRLGVELQILAEMESPSVCKSEAFSGANCASTKRPAKFKWLYPSTPRAMDRAWTASYFGQ
jgi:hypothetical protein